jgi:hypothetical protein
MHASYSGPIMEWLYLIVAIVGFIVLISVAAGLVIVPLKWSDHTHSASRINFWYAAAFVLFSAFIYLILLVNGLGELGSERFLGGLGFCFLGTLLGIVLLFIGSHIRDSFSNSLTNKEESTKPHKTNKANP